MSFNPVSAASVMSVSRCGCGCVGRVRRYPSDTTESQWAVLQPVLPVPYCQTELGGRPEKHHRRAIVDAIFYVIDNGIKWRGLPADFPPWQTVYGFFARWSADLATEDLVDDLRAALRQARGRNAAPSAGAIDSQSVAKTAEATVPKTSSGFDPHKRVNGRKRHIVVDTLGLLITVIATAANTQDRDAARPALTHAASRGIRHAWADYGYHGDLTTWAQANLGLTVQIVPRPNRKGFHVLPRRWVVERTLAWTSRRRRCARDYERLPQHHQASVQWAAIIHMSRHLARIPHPDT